jgi:DNA-binding response OmpR family regulator
MKMEAGWQSPAGYATGAVLVVEDDPPMRQLIRWVLEDEGIPVETAADGQQALEHARRRRPALVVLDMNLPFVDGDGVASGLRGFPGKTPPILVITGDGRPVEKARRVGAFALLEKPFEVDDLISVVRQGLSTT